MERTLPSCRSEIKRSALAKLSYETRFRPLLAWSRDFSIINRRSAPGIISQCDSGDVVFSGRANATKPSVRGLLGLEGASGELADFPIIT